MGLALNEDAERFLYYSDLHNKTKVTLETMQKPAPTGLHPWFYICRAANIQLLHDIISHCENEYPALKA